eukprot:4969969-Prymnesium_polylepis.1
MPYLGQRSISPQSGQPHIVAVSCTQHPRLARASTSRCPHRSSLHRSHPVSCVTGAERSARGESRESPETHSHEGGCVLCYSELL